MHIRGVVGNSSTACATHGPFGVWLQPPQILAGAPARQQLALKRNGKMAVWPSMQAAYFAMPVRPKKRRGPKTQKDAQNYCCCERNGQSCGPQLWLGQKWYDPPFCNLEFFCFETAASKVAPNVTQGKWCAAGWQGHCQHVPQHGHGHGGLGCKAFFATSFF